MNEMRPDKLRLPIDDSFDAPNAPADVAGLMVGAQVSI